MAYADNYAASLNPAFQQRVSASMASAAINISSESTGTTDHSNRVVLAKNVLTSPQQYINQFALAVAVNLAIVTLSSVTDANIDTAVSSVWNAFAGVP